MALPREPMHNDRRMSATRIGPEHAETHELDKSGYRAYFVRWWSSLDV